MSIIENSILELVHKIEDYKVDINVRRVFFDTVAIIFLEDLLVVESVPKEQKNKYKHCYD